MPSEAGSYVFTARRDVGRAHDRGAGQRLACRARTTRYDEGERASTELAERQDATYAPGDVGQVIVRGDDVDGAGPGRQGAERHVLAIAGQDHGTAMSSTSPIAEDDIGDIYVTVAFVQDGIASTPPSAGSRSRPSAQAGHADRDTAQLVAKPRDPGVFAVTVDRSPRCARACTGQHRRRRRGRSTA